MSLRTALAVLAVLGSVPAARAGESAARKAFAADLDECAAALKALDRAIPAAERVRRCVPTLVSFKALETRGRITGAMLTDGSILPVDGVGGEGPRERTLALFSHLEGKLGAAALRPDDPSLFTMSYDVPTARVQSWKFARAQARRHPDAAPKPGMDSRLEVLWRRAGALADPNLPWITAELAQAAIKGARGPAAPEAWGLLAERLDPRSRADLLPLSPQAQIVLAEALAAPAGAPPPARSTAAAWFEPVDAAAAGFAFPAAECPYEDTGVDQMPGGMAVLDYDLDGRPDLLVCAPGQARLMRNLGGFRFEDATKAAGLAGAVCRNGASSADYDNDGRPDLLLLHGKGDRDHLYRNDGGRFVDATAALGLSTAPAQSVSAVWLDYDRDGLLDLYLVEYGDLMFARDPRPDLARDGRPNRLYRNAGGRFEDATAAAGVGDAGWGLGAAAFDYDGDGDDDLFVLNDFGRSSLYRNDGGGRFTDVSRESGADFAGNGMGVSVADYDRDGRLDLFVTYVGDERPAFDPAFPAAAPAVRTRSNSEIFPIVQRNRLLRNAGGGTFVDASASALEETPTGWGWNGLFLDAGNRGWPDLYLVNGWWAFRPFYDRETKVFWRWEPEAGRFVERSRDSGASFTGNSRVSAAADLDGDGCLDLVAAGFHPLRLFRGRCPKENHWLEVKLEGSRSNRDGIGARVTAKAGGASWTQELGPQGGGFQNSLERVVRFGLGPADSADVEILWPGGTRQALGRVAANRRVVAREESGR